MAAHPPSNPSAPNDDSGAFRRSGNTKNLKPRVPEEDELHSQAALELADGDSLPPESVPLHLMPKAPLSSPTISTEPASLYPSLMPDSMQPIPAPELDAVLPEPTDSFLVPETRTVADLFLEPDDELQATGVDQDQAVLDVDWNATDANVSTGSGWLDVMDNRNPDTPSGQSRDEMPPTGKFDNVANLFTGMADSDAPASHDHWEELQPTRRMTRVDLEAAEPLSTKPTVTNLSSIIDSIPSFEQLDETDDGSHVFADYHASGRTPNEPSGVDLLNPDSTEHAAYTAPESSIFGMHLTQQQSPIDLDDDTGESEVITNLLDSNPPGSDDSSIFDRDVTSALHISGGDAVSELGHIGFDLPDTPQMSDAASQVSGRIDLGDAHSYLADLDDPKNAHLTTAADLGLDQSLHGSVDDGGPVSIFGDDELKPLEQKPKSPKVPEQAIERAPAFAASIGAGAIAKKKGTPVAEPASARKKPKPDLVEPSKKTTSKATMPLDDDEEDDIKPPPGSLGKFVAGTAFGLLASGLTFAGLYLGGVLPNKRVETASKPNTLLTQDLQPVAKAPAEPVTLNVADPAATLAALDALSDREITPKQLAARGQARFQTQLMQLSNGVATNPAELNKAEADLNLVVKQSTQSEVVEVQQAGVRAALHLGLLKETAGDTTGAMTVYSEAATKFPSARRVFETAVNRVKLMLKPSGRTSRLAPDETDRLIHAALLTSVMVQKDTKTDTKLKDEEEAGFLFWDAVNASASGKFTDAADVITKAKAAHEKRRLSLVGRNTNPLSDPTEQIFLQTCDELKELYSLKASLYAAPGSADVARKDGPVKALDAMLEQQKSQAETENKLKTQLTDASTRMASAMAIALKAEKNLEAMKVEATESAAKLNQATVALTESKDQLKLAEDTLSSVMRELQSTKIIDDKAEKKDLPKIVKSLAMATNSSDAKKAAEAMKLAQSQVEDAEAKFKQAEKDLTLAREETKLATAEVLKAKTAAETLVANIKTETTKAMSAAMSEAEKKLADAKAKRDEEIKLAIEMVKLDATKKLEEANRRAMTAEAARDTAVKTVEAQLKTQESQFQVQLAVARSGTLSILTSAESQALAEATKKYADGVTAFHENRLADAEGALAEAIKLNANDARMWYFLGLAQYQQGRTDEAAATFTSGAKLEARNQPAAKAVGESLERVQFSLRKVLDTYRQ